MIKKIAFFDAKKYDKEFFNKANEKYGFDIHYFQSQLSLSNVKITEGFDGICVFVNDTIDAPVIDYLEKNNVEIIALRCAGYNNVDLRKACDKLKIVRVPDYSPYSVAEHTVTLMMSLNRKIHRAYNRTRELNFSLQGLMGFDFFGKTAGIIGTGKIGKNVIHILKGFGMKILAYDLKPDLPWARENHITYVDLKELYSSSHVISLHCPLTEDTEYIINEENIKMMKKGVMLINTGRGKLIDTKALINGLKTGQIGFAGLDVYEEEKKYFFEDFSDTIMNDDTLARLLTFNNVIITSHQGFFTREALTNIAEITLKNLSNHFNGISSGNELCYYCAKV